jgi:curli biogenesis system outer membrane secretion channel CsgG
MKSLSKALIVALPVVFLAACAEEPAQTATVTTVQPASPAPVMETERVYQRELRK